MKHYEWKVPPTNLQLHSNEAHIWRVNFADFRNRLEYLRSILSKDEKKRADKFHFEKDRRMFTISRSLLRIILGRYVDILPYELSFSYNKYGKPELAGQSVADHVRFNISHTEGVALLAITLGSDVGVDVERVRTYKRAPGIVKRFFSEKENREYQSLPKHKRQNAFFTCWTRKEAYVKAQGRGIALGFENFSLPIDRREPPGKPLRIEHKIGTKDEGKRWTLIDIIPIRGYRAAAAARGHGLKFKYYRLRRI